MRSAALFAAGLALLFVLFVARMFAGPLAVVKHVPLASPAVVRAVVAAARDVSEATRVPPPEGTILDAPAGYDPDGITVPWPEVLAVLATQRENDFAGLEESLPACVDRAPPGYVRDPGGAPGRYVRLERDRLGRERAADSVTVCSEWYPRAAYEAARAVAWEYADEHEGTARVRRTECDVAPDGRTRCRTYETDVTVRWYEARSLEEVMTRLGLSAAEQGQVRAFLAFDLTSLRDLHDALPGGDGAPCAPSGWRPVPQPGWIWPVPGVFRVTSCFGARVDPVELLDGFHAGLDIGAPTGAMVVAARAGRVTQAGWAGACGLGVRIDHLDGTATRYCHLGRVDTWPAVRIAGGAVIGAVGSTGKSTGPHLHFEVYRHAGPVDPLLYYRP